MPPVINEAPVPVSIEAPASASAPAPTTTPPSIFGQSNSLEFNGVTEAAEVAAAAVAPAVAPVAVEAAPAAPASVLVEEKKPEQFITNSDGSFSLQTRVDGKDFAKSFTPEEIAVGLRQSETFNQRMQQIAVEKKALENRSQSLNAYDPNTLEIAKSLEELKKSNPSAFNELQYKTNSHLLSPKGPAPAPTPAPIISEEDMKALDEMAKSAPSVGVLKNIMLKLSESNVQQNKENLALRSKISENQTSFKEMQTQSLSAAKADQNQKVHDFLVSKSVDSSTIIAKSDEYDALLNSGIPAEKAVNYVFGPHFKSSEVPTKDSVKVPSVVPEGYQAVVPNSSGIPTASTTSIFGSSKRVF